MCRDLGVTLPSPLLFYLAYNLAGMGSRALYIRPFRVDGQISINRALTSLYIGQPMRCGVGGA